MKLNSFIVTLFSLFIIHCALPPKVDESMNIQRIIELPDQNQELLFTKSMEWFSTSFKSSKAVIDYSDIETGIIMGNGNMDYGGILTAGYDVLFSIKVDVKDNRSRITLGNFILRIPPSKYAGEMEAPMVVRDFEKVRPKLEALATNYVEYMNQNTESDW
ncbi:MAG: DUF4468 domain-containing protein [Candidatus Brocadiales bacterium]|nr:DUF4468 domain-containing protein [Candidatus Brocadiales bacterium]